MWDSNINDFQSDLQSVITSVTKQFNGRTLEEIKKELSPIEQQIVENFSKKYNDPTNNLHFLIEEIIDSRWKSLGYNK